MCQEIIQIEALEFYGVCSVSTLNTLKHEDNFMIFLSLLNIQQNRVVRI